MVSWFAVAVPVAQGVLRLTAGPSAAALLGDAAAALSAGRESTASEAEALQRAVAAALQKQFEPVLMDREWASVADEDVQSVLADVGQVVATISADATAEALAASTKDVARLERHLVAGTAGARRGQTSEELQPLFDLVLQAALREFVHRFQPTQSAQSAMLRALVDPSGRAPVPRDRLVRIALENRRLLDPDQIPAMSRDDLVSRARASSPRVLLGEGGLGKSVLAGQVFDAEPDRLRLLIACSRLTAVEDLTSRRRLSLAFGHLVTEDDDRDLLDVLAGLGEVPLVIIDTVDLLTTASTTAAVAELLEAVAARADLVVTCRRLEWEDLLSVNWQVQNPMDLPRLTGPEVLRWTGRFLERHNVIDTVAAAFLAAVAKTLGYNQGTEVLNLPLRLAMACTLYAESGSIPTDLTATKLYTHYWDQRVARDRHQYRRTPAARAAERAARQTAKRIWRESNRHRRLIEEVPEPEDVAGAATLLSDGVLVSRGAGVQFFHQTFAEFAVARFIARRCSEKNLKKLNIGLLERRSGSWGIVAHLLVEPVSDDGFDRVVGSVPMEVPEGPRLVLGAIFDRAVKQPDRIDDLRPLLQRVLVEAPDAVVGAQDLLLDTPSALLGDLVDFLAALVTQDRAGMGRPITPLALLLRRVEPGLAATTLGSVLDALLEPPETPRTQQQQGRLASDLARLLNLLLDDPAAPPALRGVAIGRYLDLPPAAQHALLRGSTPGHADERAQLLDKALQADLPARADQTVADLMQAEWDDPDSREQRGWTSWVDLTRQKWLKGWPGAVVRLLRSLGAADAALRGDLIRTAVGGSAGSQRDLVLNTVRFYAGDFPEATASTLLTSTLKADRGAVATFAQACIALQPQVDGSVRRRLADRLLPLVEHAPRQAWAAAAKLSASESARLDGVLAGLRTAVVAAAYGQERAQVVQATLDALTQVLQGEALEPYRERLEELADLAGLVVLRRAQLTGALALSSRQSRDQVDALLSTNRANAQALAVSRLAGSRSAWSHGQWQANLSWIVDCLRMRVDGAVRDLALALVPDAGDPRWTRGDTTAVIARLSDAVQRGEDAQTVDALIRLLAALVHDGPDDGRRPRGDEVRTLLDEVLSALIRAIGGGSVRAPALHRQAGDLLTKLLRFTQPTPVFVRAATGFVENFDTATVGSNAVATLVNTVTAMLAVDLELWTRFETWWPKLPVANRRAIAEVVMDADRSDARDVGYRLARRSDCPDDVARLLLGRLARA